MGRPAMSGATAVIAMSGVTAAIATARPGFPASTIPAAISLLKDA
jgi:hypothetical protein